MASNSTSRRPMRSARSTRPTNYYAKSFRPAPSVDENDNTSQAPGFFPALTHFTDSIGALPKEIIHHLTMLRESDGKAYAPDLAINDLVTSIKSVPDPPIHHDFNPAQAYLGLSAVNSTTASVAGSVLDGATSSYRDQTNSLETQIGGVDEHAELRQSLHLQLQDRLREIIGSLEEKTMVLNATNDTMTRQLARVESSLPYLDDEISEEARLGSKTHWALPHMKELRRWNAQPPEEKARRLALNKKITAEADDLLREIDTSRSEARREAVLAKRGRIAHAESDFDDRANKRHAASTKVRKGVEPTTNVKTAINTASQSHKRRRIDNKPPGAMAAALNNRLTTTKKDRTRSSPAPEAARRRAKPLPAPAVSRKKVPAAASSITSSPTRGTFGGNTAQKARSPAPTSHRTAVSRIRQSSTNSVLQDSRSPPVHTNGKINESNGSHSLSERNNAHASGTVQGNHDALGISKGTGNYTEDKGQPNSRWAEQSESQDLKREDTEVEEEDESAATSRNFAPQPPQRPRGGSRSKPATPLQTNFTEASGQTMVRSRSTRGAANGNGSAASPPLSAVSASAAATVSSPRRSHKKGASISRPAASKATGPLSPAKALSRPTSGSPLIEQAVITTGKNTNGTSSRSRANAAKVSKRDDPANGTEDEQDEEEEPDEDDEDEPRYCVCNGVSFGDMIACDNANCEKEWFHLECVGLSSGNQPSASSKWYCSDRCKEMATSTW